MSIASEISRLQNNSTAIASSIAAKGVTVPSGSGYDDYAFLIDQISSGDVDPDAWLKDGDSHFWIEIASDYQKQVDLMMRFNGTIDWGDGTAKETVSSSTYTTFSHTYSEKGKYRIDLHHTSGSFYLGGGANGYNFLGVRSNETYYKYSILYQVEIGSGISLIGNYAFYTMTGLRKVYIPKTVTTLSSGTFANCSALESVEFEPGFCANDSATTSFQYCSNLQALINFAATSTSIGGFRACYPLMEIIIPSTVTGVPAYTFTNCYCLKRLFCLPATAPTVANANAFSGFPSTCMIYVPIDSLASYQSANIWSSYSSQMVEAGKITLSLTNVSSSNSSPMAEKNGSYTTTLTADGERTLGTVTVMMGGTDITSTAYSNGVVSIQNITGDITITATAQ